MNSPQVPNIHDVSQIPPKPNLELFEASEYIWISSAFKASSKSINGQQKASCLVRKLFHTSRSALISLFTRKWWWGFNTPFVCGYNLRVNALPNIMHLHRKFKNPHSFCSCLSVIFLLCLLSTSSMSLSALLTFETGIHTTWFTVLIRNPRNDRSVVAQ